MVSLSSLVKEFTYLGVTFNGSTSFQPALKELSNQANRALFSLNSKYKLSKLPLDIAIKLFDVMISPILLHGSEYGVLMNTIVIRKISTNGINHL